MYSIKYTSVLIEEITGEALGKDFIAQVRMLRDKWGNGDISGYKKELMEITKKSIPVVLSFIKSIDLFLKKEHFESGKDLVFQNKKYKISFTDNWSEADCIKKYNMGYIKFRVPFLGKSIENFNLFLPHTFSLPFIFYISGDGLFSSILSYYTKGRYLKNIQSIGIQRHTKYMNILFGRMIATRGFYRMPFLYGLSIIDAERPFVVRAIKLFVSTYRIILRRI